MLTKTPCTLLSELATSKDLCHLELALTWSILFALLQRSGMKCADPTVVIYLRIVNLSPTMEL